MKKIDLFVVDPQNSFCKIVPADQQQVLHTGELFVDGASDAMKRLAALIDRLADSLNDIHISLESRHLMHISHPHWYQDANGNPPQPFTRIRAEGDKIVGSRIGSKRRWVDVGEFVAFRPSIHKRTLTYLRALKAGNHFNHVIWPPHCLIGTAGHAVVDDLMQPLLKWEARNFASVDYVTKGSNHFVEHFSAVQAEVPDVEDPSTQINTDLCSCLDYADTILFAGVGRAGAVLNTVKDILTWHKHSDLAQKCVLLTDCTAVASDSEPFLWQVTEQTEKAGLRTIQSCDLSV
jgi:nicotinamidase-related amidase